MRSSDWSEMVIYPMNKADELSIELITAVLDRLYGYDFSEYSMPSLKRRLIYHKDKHQLKSLADMIPLLIKNKEHFNELLSDLSVTVTEFFRDPAFYQFFRDDVVPRLQTYPYPRIWHAGCATGEEPYSMAILLAESDMLDRCELIATDFNPYAIEVAKKGIYPGDQLDNYQENYKAFGGAGEFNDFVTQKYDAIKVSDALQSRIHFSEHNLAVDDPIEDVEVVVCRNVMIYFDSPLKRRTLELFHQSLVTYGFLCLGANESMDDDRFKQIGQGVYQKVGKS